MTAGRQPGQGKGEPRTSPARLKAAVRQAKAIDMKIAGETYEAIRQELGYASRSGALNAVEAALAKLAPIPTLEQARKLDWERMEKMHQALWPRVVEGDPESCRVCIRLMERRAKLLGLDALPSLNAISNDAVQGVLDALIGLAVRMLTPEQRPAFMEQVGTTLLQIDAPRETP